MVAAKKELKLVIEILNRLTKGMGIPEGKVLVLRYLDGDPDWRESKKKMRVGVRNTNRPTKYKRKPKEDKEVKTVKKAAKKKTAKKAAKKKATKKKAA